MPKFHKINGYAEFRNFVTEIKDSDTVINLYFSGTKGENGVSWCSDCAQAEPIIQDFINLAPEDSMFVYVDVGERPVWKNITNPFRTDKDVHLMVIPTLICWNTPKRLENEQCNKPELLEMFFTDND